jgi:hypothetical protein
MRRAGRKKPPVTTPHDPGAQASSTGKRRPPVGQEDFVAETARPRIVGFNHIALEVGDTEKITILVVDDDALITASTVDMLAELGHDVTEANSDDRALDGLRGSAGGLSYQQDQMEAEIVKALKKFGGSACH